MLKPTDWGAWGDAARAAETVRELARLMPADVRLAVIKGVHLAHCVAPHPWHRRMADADVVVLDGQILRALEAAVAGGFRVEGACENQVVLRSPALGTLDLHDRPFPVFFGRQTEAVFREGLEECRVFGIGVLAPRPADAGVLAIGHFVKDGLVGHLAADLALLVDHAHLTPVQLADRVEAYGLRLAAIVALTRLRDQAARWDVWLAALRPTRWEATVSELYVRWLPDQRTWRLWLAGRYVADPMAAVVGAAWRLAYAVERRVVGHTELLIQTKTGRWAESLTRTQPNETRSRRA